MRRTPPLAGIVAGVVLVVACSLEGLDDGPSRGGDGGVTDAGTSEAAPPVPDVGCPGCEVLVTGEEKPTEIAILDGRLHWIRDATRGAVVRSDLDGKGLRFEPDFPIANGHDLAGAFNGAAYESVFAIGSDRVLHRYLAFSSCDNAGDTLRASSMGNDLLLARVGELARGDCGSRTPLLPETVVGVAGDPPFAWFTRDNGEIARCDATSAAQCVRTSTVMATGQGVGRTLARDDSRLSWVKESAPVELRSRRKADIGPTAQVEVVATGLREPKTIVPAGADVYWTDAAREILSLIHI